MKNCKVDIRNAEGSNVQANIVTIQETHFSQKGKIRMNSELVVFEAIRKPKVGGKVLAVHVDLNPKLGRSYEATILHSTRNRN